MSILKSFVLGAAAAYGIQHITKKRADGSSILSDFMDNPPDFVNKAKDYATENVNKAKDYAAESVNKAKDYASETVNKAKDYATESVVNISDTVKNKVAL